MKQESRGVVGVVAFGSPVVGTRAWGGWVGVGGYLSGQSPVEVQQDRARMHQHPDPRATVAQAPARLE